MKTIPSICQSLPILIKKRISKINMLIHQNGRQSQISKIEKIKKTYEVSLCPA
jgi:hypothetical protein